MESWTTLVTCSAHPSFPLLCRLVSQPATMLPMLVSVSATPGIYGNYVIFPSWNGVLYAFGKYTNQLIWSKDIRQTYFPKLKTSRVNIRTTPAFYGNSFLVGTNGSAYILKIEIATGKLLGKLVASSHVSAGPCISSASLSECPPPRSPRRPTRNTFAAPSLAPS